MRIRMALLLRMLQWSSSTSNTATTDLMGLGEIVRLRSYLHQSPLHTMAKRVRVRGNNTPLRHYCLQA